MTDKDIKKMEWETTVRAVGNTGMITISKSLIGKRVKVSIEVIED